MDSLRSALASAGVQVDAVADRADALARFFATGGHGALILGPDVAPGAGWALAGALRDIAPDLAVVAFGGDLARSPQALRDAHLLPDFHPDSRAAEGAVLRALGVPPRGPGLVGGPGLPPPEE